MAEHVGDVLVTVRGTPIEHVGDVRVLVRGSITSVESVGDVLVAIDAAQRSERVADVLVRVADPVEVAGGVTVAVHPFRGYGRRLPRARPTVYRGQQSQAATPQPFGQSFWRQPADATLDPSSAEWVAQIAATDHSFATHAWTPPIYTVGTIEPGTPITCVAGTGNNPAGHEILNAAVNIDGGVPFPAGAQPSPDTDSSIVVYQPDWDDGTGQGVGRVWEFWRASSPQQNAPGADPLPWGEASHGDSAWHAWWGGRMSYLSASPGYPVNRTFGAVTHADHVATAQTEPAYELSGWMSTATGLPLLAGVVRLEDWTRRSINHAVGIALPHDMLSPTAVWPAQRSDGSGDPSAIPEGAVLKMPAGYVPDPALPEIVRMLAVAARDYGLVVWDASLIASVRFELRIDPEDPTVDPWLSEDGPFWVGGTLIRPFEMADLFPFADLQACSLTGGP